jgi:adenosylcobinamide-GDP ribazoletransferase
MNDFLLMLQFLTRIPVNKSLECENRNFRKGALYLPVVGLIIGGIQWIVYYLLNKVLPVNITAIFVVLIGILITGALHVDGLGDTCDGFFAFKGRDRIIEIMKDSRIGTFAGIAIVMDILLKVIASGYIIERNIALVLIVSPVIGRFSIMLISLISKPAKSTGSGNLFIGNMSKSIVILAGTITLTISSLLLGFKASAVIFIASVIITILSSKYSTSKIGGLTGDILGANNELVEIFVMIVFIALN